jgi:hypothetical protein
MVGFRDEPSARMCEKRELWIWPRSSPNDAKERLVISGISGERLCSLVRD